MVQRRSNAALKNDVGAERRLCKISYTVKKKVSIKNSAIPFCERKIKLDTHMYTHTDTYMYLVCREKIKFKNYLPKC